MKGSGQTWCLFSFLPIVVAESPGAITAINNLALFSWGNPYTCAIISCHHLTFLPSILARRFLPAIRASFHNVHMTPPLEPFHMLAWRPATRVTLLGLQLDDCAPPMHQVGTRIAGLQCALRIELLGYLPKYRGKISYQP